MQVRKIQVPSDDPKWSVDIKLGVLNIMQLNLQPINSPELSEVTQHYREKLAGHYETIEV